MSTENSSPFMVVTAPLVGTPINEEDEVDVTDAPSPFMVVAAPLVGTPVGNSQSHDFTGADFEDALDKASRSVKGKYADVPYSSEDFIRDKRKEAELEDRSL